jgi:lipoprotein-anchoring transpeptidase ErfK/SrfK
MRLAAANARSEAVRRSAWRGAWGIAARIALIAIALLLIPYVLQTVKPEAPSSSIAGMPNNGVEPIVFSPVFAFYYLPETASKPLWGEALYRMIGERRESDKHLMLLSGSRSVDGKWSIWPNKPNPLLSVQAGSQGRSAVTYYDAKACECTPEDASPYEPYIGQWKREQEEGAVLRSAVEAYEALNGAKPENVEQLYRPYPHNVIGGVTPYMREVFAQEQKNGWKPSASAVIEGSDPGSAANETGAAQNRKLVQSPLLQPLSIVVDKAKHRLALVSGDLIVRSYPVGLGGDKTPEGEFIISEKVREPNGKINGDFGSRGMTLSDTLYAIHGTNKPDSVGKDESLGCIRMLKSDVEELFDMVPLHTKVQIGVNVLPDQGSAGGSAADGAEAPGKPFMLPGLTEERNPNKVYRWL